MGQQFKVGDRVKIIEEDETVPLIHQVGRMGIILTVDSNFERLYIGLGNAEAEDHKWWWDFDKVELIEQSQTSLSDTDKVNPSHYKKGSVECIDAIKAATVGKSGFEGYMVGNIIKYVFRYEDKGGVEDLKKASWYLNKLIDERST